MERKLRRGSLLLLAVFLLSTCVERVSSQDLFSDLIRNVAKIGGNGTNDVTDALVENLLSVGQDAAEDLFENLPDDVSDTLSDITDLVTDSKDADSGIDLNAIVDEVVPELSDVLEDVLNLADETLQNVPVSELNSLLDLVDTFLDDNGVNLPIIDGIGLFNLTSFIDTNIPGRNVTDGPQTMMLTNLLNSILDDFGVNVTPVQVQQMAATVNAIYQAVKQNLENTSSSTPEDIFRDILQATMTTVLESNREEIRCSLVQYALDYRLQDQPIDDNVKTRMVDIILRVLGCGQGSLFQILSEVGNYLQQTLEKILAPFLSIRERIENFVMMIRAKRMGADFNTTRRPLTTTELVFRTTNVARILTAKTTEAPRTSAMPGTEGSRLGNLLKNLLETRQDTFTGLREGRQDLSDFLNRTNLEVLDRILNNTQDVLRGSVLAIVNDTVSLLAKELRTQAQPYLARARAVLMEAMQYPVVKLLVGYVVETVGNPSDFESFLRRVIPNLTESQAQAIGRVASLVAQSPAFVQLQADVSDMLESEDVSETSDDLMTSDDPMVQALVQTAVSTLESADLSDPSTVLTSLTQSLLQNVAQMVQDTVLSDPVQFLSTILKGVQRNNSIIARVIPAETLQAIVEGVSPFLQVSSLGYGLARIYSSGYNTSQRCATERAAVATGLTQLQPWALTFLDSMGKLDTGILQGNTYLMGNFDQCMSISDLTDSGDVIEGSYVKYRIKIPLPAGFPAVAGLMPGQETGLPYLHWQLCLPAGCNHQDVAQIGQGFSATFEGSLSESSIVTRRKPLEDTVFILAM